MEFLTVTKNIRYLLYADDLVILTNDPNQLQLGLSRLSEYCSLNNLQVNTEKTKCLTFYRGVYKPPVFQYNGVSLQNCNEFKYLGVILTTRLSSSKHVHSLISKCNSVVAQLFFRLPLQDLPLEVALDVFKVYVLPIVEYALACWLPNLCQSVESALNAVLSKFLKRFLGVPYSTYTSLVHFVTNTYPLCDYLRSVHQARFFTLKFPPCVSGLHFQVPENVTLPLGGSVDVENIPSFFWHSPVIEQLPVLSTPKRAVLYDSFDLFHYQLCNRKEFHTGSMVSEELCSCKFCGEPIAHFHHRTCYELKHLSLCSILKKLSVEGRAAY